MTNDAVPPPGTVIAEKYRIERLIGEGGMGAVLAATHLHLRTEVALKFLLGGGAKNPAQAERFAREARIGATLNSDYIVRVSDTGVHDGDIPFMVMEYLHGHDLSRHAQLGDLATPMVVTYMLQVCEALAEAHAKEITHRDLKPANLFVVKRADGRAHVKVLDFGIAKMVDHLGLDSDLTKTTALMGSPLYMPPERLRTAKEADPRGDIWALGAILFELLCGKAVFSGDTLPVVCSNILNQEPRQVSEHRPDRGSAFDAIVARCLRKKKEERYPNVAALAADLAPFAPSDASDAVERMCRLLGITAASLVHVSTLPGFPKPPAQSAAQVGFAKTVAIEDEAPAGSTKQDGTPAGAMGVQPPPAAAASTTGGHGAQSLASAAAEAAAQYANQPSAHHAPGITTSLESTALPSRRSDEPSRWPAVAVGALLVSILAGGGIWYATNGGDGDAGAATDAAAAAAAGDKQPAAEGTAAAEPTGAAAAGDATAGEAVAPAPSASSAASAAATASASATAVMAPPRPLAPFRRPPLATAAPQPTGNGDDLFDDRK